MIVFQDSLQDVATPSVDRASSYVAVQHRIGIHPSEPRYSPLHATSPEEEAHNKDKTAPESFTKSLS